MTETVEAIFDGHVFRPIWTPSLTANKRYTLIIKHKDEEPETRNAFDVLSDLTGTVEGPEDWAVHHDRYLYGEIHRPLHPENDSDKQSTDISRYCFRHRLAEPKGQVSQCCQRADAACPSINLQRAILIREGHRPRTDDVPADFNFTDPVETVFMNPEVIVPGPGDEIVSHKGKTLDRGVYESIRREFYELRGWDAETGEQKKGTLERMGLEELVE